MIKKIIHAVQGLFLMAFHVRLFPIHILRDKRIAVVGPASSAYDTNKGDYIDGFDLVVRINKAPLMIRDKRSLQDIGKRTDILFHSFFENEYSGGGKIDLPLYEQLGIRYLVNPIPTFFGHRVTFNFFKKYRRPHTVYTLPLTPYKKLAKRFGKYRVTTGFCALKTLVEADFEELYITGFTFFQTSYGEGYRDAMRSREATQQYIEKMQIHNPDLEFSEFVRIYKENKHKNIKLDPELENLVENYKGE